MVQTLDALWHIAAAVLLVLFLLISGVKVIWNIGLPYAMIRGDLRGVHRGWSAFPLIEVMPLVGAAGFALLLPSGHLFSATKSLLWGGLAIIGSYLHLAVVAAVYGLCRRHEHV